MPSDIEDQISIQLEKDLEFVKDYKIVI